MGRPLTLHDRASFTIHLEQKMLDDIEALRQLLVVDRPGSAISRADAARQAIARGIETITAELEASASRKKK